MFNLQPYTVSFLTGGQRVDPHDCGLDKAILAAQSIFKAATIAHGFEITLLERGKIIVLRGASSVSVWGDDGVMLRFYRELIEFVSKLDERLWQGRASKEETLQKMKECAGFN